ncbi:MAG: class II fructose-bisphosphate aldolase [Anaerolineae bacterium]|nr:class II fructose-bisphosphate aldolase [Anaerolineae bacterium]
MIHESVYELKTSLNGIVDVSDDGKVSIQDRQALREKAIDTLVRNAVFGADDVREYARWLIWEMGQALGAQPASIHDLYMARGRGECSGFTVPAMNMRGLAYDMMRAALRAALKVDARAIIFEIARSEIGYTSQRPAEYTSVLIAAAIKEGYEGPLFIQGDHFQVKASAYKSNPEAELQAVKDITLEALKGGFFNIDVDTSTLVDLSYEDLDSQQKLNYTLSAEMTRFIREHQPKGVTVSIGGEIGEVGGHNSTEGELRAYMDGYNRTLKSYGGDLPGLSKISVQTGTSHGGIVLPDGSIARVALDFDTLERLSRLAREEYGMAGAVQHGASTLPEEMFHRFPETETAEIHLATGFQNLLYDHEAMPAEFVEKIYAYLSTHHADERKPGDTDTQFFYRTRKRAFGPFKAEWWGLPESVRQAFGETLEEKFSFFFGKLNVVNTKDLVAKYVKAPEIHKPMPGTAAAADDDSKGLAD